jgi:hypothetical protein
VGSAQASRFALRRSKMLDPQAPAGFHREQHSAQEQQQNYRRHTIRSLIQSRRRL